MSIFTIFHFFFWFLERSMATIWDLAGHFSPAGHRLGTPGLKSSLRMLV